MTFRPEPVTELPPCEFCDEEARITFRTRRNEWANGCLSCWAEHRRFDELGENKGYKIVVVR